MTQDRELAEVLALLEKATLGEWVDEDNRTWVTPQPSVRAGETKVARLLGDDFHVTCTVGKYERECANASAIAAAVNFLRKHGPALLSRTPAGEDARDAERYRRWRLLAASGTMSDEVCDMMIAARTEDDIDAAIAAAAGGS